MPKNNSKNSLQLDGRQRSVPSICAGIFAALLLCLGFSLATAPGATAHDQIISINPKPGEQLAAAPADLKFIFSNSLLSLGSEVRVMDASDKDWARGTPALSGEKLTQPLTAGMPDGEYLIRWRVVSSDGHPISGTQTFLVGDAAAAGTGATSGQQTTRSPVAEPKLRSQSSKPATTSPAAAAPAPQSGNPWTSAGKLIPAGIGAAAGLGIYVTFIVIRRVRHSTKQAN